MRCFLRMGSDYPEDAQPCDSIADAKWEFERVARELDRYGQKVEASIHIPTLHSNGKFDIDEYPDYVLRLGPKGGLVCERA